MEKIIISFTDIMRNENEYVAFGTGLNSKFMGFAKTPHFALDLINSDSIGLHACVMHY